MKLFNRLRKPVPEAPLSERVIATLREIHDPEIPINIYDLGLIYSLDIDDHGQVTIRMTLTTPACPVAQSFPGHVQEALERIEGVSEARVELVWDPPWDQSRISAAARLDLGLY